MKRHLISLILIVLSIPEIARAAQPVGFLIMYDGTRTKEYATALEYSQFVYYGDTWKAVLLNGKLISGASRNLLENRTYTNPTDEEVARIELIAKWNENAKLFLPARISAMKKELANPPPKPDEPVIEASIPSLRMGGQVFTKVIPRRILDTTLGFMSAEGAFTIPLNSLPLKTLRELNLINDVAKESAAFQEALASFLPVVVANRDKFTGVQLKSFNRNGTVSLRTDTGPAVCKVENLAQATQNALKLHPLKEPEEAQPTELKSAAAETAKVLMPQEENPLANPPKQQTSSPAQAAAQVGEPKYGGMALGPKWMPLRTETKRGLMRCIDFYAKQATNGGDPRTIWGPITWLMPESKAIEAISSLRNGLLSPHKGSESRITMLCFPEDSLVSIDFEFKTFNDGGVPFQHLYLILDKQRRVVSVQLEDRTKRPGWGLRWLIYSPDPYFNFINLSNNSNGATIHYKIDSDTVTTIKVWNSNTSTLIHWHMPAPFAQCLSDIADHHRQLGLFK
jgi:hypothetical protein